MGTFTLLFRVRRGGGVDKECLENFSGEPSKESPTPKAQNNVNVEL
jgi:hypothetical protein